MVEEYAQLLATYRRMFGMVDAFHFNSQNTADVYRRYLDIPEASKVIPITHGEIKDHRKVRTYNANMLQLGFIGSEDPYKGLPMLKEVIKRLNKKGYTDKLSLAVYGGRIGVDEHLPNVYYKGRFGVEMQETVYDDMDLLVVPSIWNETFSLVTIEALSYGTCVLVSNMVGAKDIIKQYDSQFIYDTEESLFSILRLLIDDKDILINYNNRIVSMDWKWSIRCHSAEMVGFYSDICRHIKE